MKFIEKLLKSFFGSIKIPSLLSFFILRDGTKNPTLSESLKDASKENSWTRLGLGNLAFGSVPTWSLFLFLFFIVAIADMGLFVKSFALVLMIILFYFLIKSWGQKN